MAILRIPMRAFGVATMASAAVGLAPVFAAGSTCFFKAWAILLYSAVATSYTWLAAQRDKVRRASPVRGVQKGDEQSRQWGARGASKQQQQGHGGTSASGLAVMGIFGMLDYQRRGFGVARKQAETAAYSQAFCIAPDIGAWLVVVHGVREHKCEVIPNHLKVLIDASLCRTGQDRYIQRFNQRDSQLVI